MANIWLLLGFLSPLLGLWLGYCYSRVKGSKAYNENQSDIRNAIYGGPQGSILDHYDIKFILTILLPSRANCIMCLFADDTNAFISGNYLKKLSNTLHLKFDQILVEINKKNIESTEYTLYGVSLR